MRTHPDGKPLTAIEPCAPIAAQGARTFTTAWFAPGSRAVPRRLACGHATRMARRGAASKIRERPIARRTWAPRVAEDRRAHPSTRHYNRELDGVAPEVPPELRAHAFRERARRAAGPRAAGV